MVSDSYSSSKSIAWFNYNLIYYTNKFLGNNPFVNTKLLKSSIVSDFTITLSCITINESQFFWYNNIIKFLTDISSSTIRKDFL